jgi:hypothetical protein
MAKAVVPMSAFRARHGNLQAPELNRLILELVLQFLHEHAAPERRKADVTSS